MKLSEYEVRAMVHCPEDDPALPGNSADVSCNNCIFSPPEENKEVCLNHGTNPVFIIADIVSPDRASTMSLPDCRNHIPNSGVADEYGTIYKLVHRLSGKVLTAQDAKDLVDYYKSQNHE